VLAPAEYVPVFAVDLPLSQHRMRLEALPFAFEDRVSQPIEDLHIALGPEVGQRRYLAAVVAKERMSAWLAQLAEAGVVPGRILPDASVLPAPETGAAWSVLVENERVLIRTLEGEAFATALALFDALWNAAGRPPLHQLGANWPDLMPQPESKRLDFVIASPSGPAVDLLQGAFRGPRGRFDAPLKIAAGILVAAILAHTALLATDTVIASRAVTQRTSEARAVLATVAPDLALAPDPAAVLTRMLPRAGDGGSGSGFVALLARASAAIELVSGGVTLQSLAYDEADGALQLRVEASDLPSIERIDRAFQQSGLSTQSGGAAMAEGRAESMITVRDTAAAP